MPLRKQFSLADELVGHLRTLAAGESDPRVLAIYSGFVAVSAVTVYELALRTVLVEFASPRDSAFGSYMESSLSRINGRIKVAELQDRFLKTLGGRYLSRFKRLLKAAEASVLRKQGRSVTSSYSNIVTWRHEFAHQGRPPVTPTFDEACQSYELGKLVIECLRRSLKR